MKQKTYKVLIESDEYYTANKETQLILTGTKEEIYQAVKKWASSIPPVFVEIKKDNKMYLSIYDNAIFKIVCFLKNDCKETLYKYALENYKEDKYLMMYVNDESITGDYRKLIKEV